MSEAKLTMNMDNAAFGECNGYELARILRDLADKVDGAQHDDDYWVAKDINGNTVGKLIISEE